MKNKSLLLILFLSADAIAVPFSLDLYGNLNLSYDAFAAGDDDPTSNASRIGIKGEHRLSSGLAFFYQLEQGVDVVHGGKRKDTLFNTRDSYLGIRGRFGKFFFGTHDTPTKKGQAGVDLFDNQAGDIKTLLVGEVRARDSWGYESPKFFRIKVFTMYVPGDNHFDSSQSLSIGYDKDGLIANLTFDKDMRKNDVAVAKTKVYDSVRAVIQYKFNDWQLAALYQTSEQQSSEQHRAGAGKKNGFVVSASYHWNNFVLKSQYGSTDLTAANRDNLQFGLDYRLGKHSRLYLIYLDQEDDQGSLEVLSSGFEVRF